MLPPLVRRLSRLAAELAVLIAFWWAGGWLAKAIGLPLPGGVVGLAALFTVLLGLPTGVLLFVSRRNGLAPMPKLNAVLGAIINFGRSLPFIVLLIALLVVASMFVGVCYHAYTRYSEIHTGRATWGQFGLTVAVGAILLVVGIWLLTKATGVL